MDHDQFIAYLATQTDEQVEQLVFNLFVSDRSEPDWPGNEDQEAFLRFFHVWNRVKELGSEAEAVRIKLQAAVKNLCRASIDDQHESKLIWTLCQVVRSRSALPDFIDAAIELALRTDCGHLTWMGVPIDPELVTVRRRLLRLCFPQVPPDPAYDALKRIMERIESGDIVARLKGSG